MNSIFSVKLKNDTQRTLIRKPTIADEAEFIALAKDSLELHYPWIESATNHDKFEKYLTKVSLENNESFLVCLKNSNHIIGVVNLNEITRGALQSAYLAYWAFSRFAGRGYMKEGLGLVIDYSFGKLGLHRLEANIQPKNKKSIGLVQSLGFKKEGFSEKYLKINGVWRDHERWAILSEDRFRLKR